MPTQDPSEQTVLGTKDFIKQAKLLRDVKEKGAYRDYGYRSFRDWADEKWGSFTGAYDKINIAKLLDHLDEATLRRIGSSKCIELARVVRRRQELTDGLINDAVKMKVAEFKSHLRNEFPGSYVDFEFGPRMDFEEMPHEPLSENGVIFLFGVLCKDNLLPFTVEAIKESYPDCSAKQRQRDRRERVVYIEFEHKSSGFKDHVGQLKANPNSCQYCVCWVHNWGEIPVQVIELGRIRKLGRSDISLERLLVK